MILQQQTADVDANVSVIVIAAATMAATTEITGDFGTITADAAVSSGF